VNYRVAGVTWGMDRRRHTLSRTQEAETPEAAALAALAAREDGGRPFVGESVSVAGAGVCLTLLVEEAPGGGLRVERWPENR
jgi:hypothetical protein